MAKPLDPTYDEAMQRLFETLKAEGQQVSFVGEELKHRHGSFPAVNVGIALGPGDTTPSRRDINGHDDMVNRLLKDNDMRRLAAHQNCMLCASH